MQRYSTVREALAQIRLEATKMDGDDRRALIAEMRNIAAELEDGTEACHQMMVSPVTLALAYIGLNSRIFTVLEEAGRPMHVTEILAQIPGDTIIVGRLCRAMTARHMINETSEDTFAASHVTKACLLDYNAAGIIHNFYHLNELIATFPEHLESTEYRTPADQYDNAFSLSMGMSKTAFDWLNDHPFELENWNTYMKYMDRRGVEWTDFLPLREYLRDWPGDRPLFVDIGCGGASQCQRFRDVTVGITGRVVMQDRASVLAAEPEHRGIEKMAADYFQPQPVRGAKFYFLRNLLFEYTDEVSVIIIRHIMDAMASDSLLVFDETVMPNRSGSALTTSLDLVVVAAHGGTKRTEREWYHLLEGKCGLHIASIVPYDRAFATSVIVCSKI